MPVAPSVFVIYLLYLGLINCCEFNLAVSILFVQKLFPSSNKISFELRSIGRLVLGWIILKIKKILPVSSDVCPTSP